MKNKRTKREQALRTLKAVSMRPLSWQPGAARAVPLAGLRQCPQCQRYLGAPLYSLPSKRCPFCGYNQREQEAHMEWLNERALHKRTTRRPARRAPAKKREAQARNARIAAKKRAARIAHVLFRWNKKKEQAPRKQRYAIRKRCKSCGELMPNGLRLPLCLQCRADEKLFPSEGFIGGVHHQVGGGFCGGLSSGFETNRRRH